MRRRDLIGAISAAALALPFDAAAQQQSKVWRTGNVYNSTSELVGRLAQALEQHLADLGYVQGRNIVLVNRFAGPEPDKLREVISSLVPQIDILVAWGTAGGIAAKKIVALCRQSLRYLTLRRARLVPQNASIFRPPS